jgi:cytochrome c5
MFRLWGYPFDAERHQSTAPPSLVLLHRLVGLAYVVLYVFMMWQMVPRLFQYQVEFPARTVAHLMLGVSIGFLLILKVYIIRCARSLSSMLPYMGVGLLWCTVLLASLSVPFAFKERLWSSNVAGGSVYSDENLERIGKLLPGAGFPAAAPLAELTSKSALQAGRRVLLTKCVMCHDLKTILIKPRIPADWVRTVERMADKPVIGQPINEREEWVAATYLIAISPDLQASEKQRRNQQKQQADRRDTMRKIAAEETVVEAVSYDLAAAKELFEDTCTMCHELDEMDGYELVSDQAVRELVERMVENGLESEESELEQIVWFINQEYVSK